MPKSDRFDTILSFRIFSETPVFMRVSRHNRLTFHKASKMLTFQGVAS